jgi:hypothetical protein
MKVKVGEFGQWVKEAFVETNGVDLRGAKQIASAANSLWAITCAGVVKFDGKSWCTANADWTEQPSLLLASRNGAIWVNAGEQIFLWTERVGEFWTSPSRFLHGRKRKTGLFGLWLTVRCGDILANGNG